MVCELYLKTAIFLSVLKNLSEGHTLLIRCYQGDLCSPVVPLLPLQTGTSQLSVAPSSVTAERLRTLLKAVLSAAIGSTLAKASWATQRCARRPLTVPSVGGESSMDRARRPESCLFLTLCISERNGNRELSKA